MTREELKQAFEDCGDDYCEFDKVANKRSTRADLHAFLLLDSLVLGKADIVARAAHDEIWLDTDIEELAAVATPEIVKELVQSGVRLDSGSLAMFV